VCWAEQNLRCHDGTNKQSVPKHFNNSDEVRTGVHLRIQNNWAGDDSKVCTGAAEAASEHQRNVHVRFHNRKGGKRPERTGKKRKRQEIYIYEQKTHEFSGLQATQVAKNGLAQAG
jgi:hypothetical protein